MPSNLVATAMLDFLRRMMPASFWIESIELCDMKTNTQPLKYRAYLHTNANDINFYHDTQRFMSNKRSQEKIYFA